MCANLFLALFTALTSYNHSITVGQQNRSENDNAMVTKTIKVLSGPLNLQT